MQVTLEVTPQIVFDLITTCVEGGSTYWCAHMEVKKGGQPASYLKLSTWEGEDWIVTVETQEDDPATFGPAEMAKAFAASPGLLAEFLADEGGWDAISADVILQQAAFGEVVYG